MNNILLLKAPVNILHLPPPSSLERGKKGEVKNHLLLRKHFLV
jgi:hypothetical protein